jgi:hypothetical protein
MHLPGCPQTDTLNVVKQPTQNFLNPNDIVKDVASNFKFNEKQLIAFEIASKCFIESHIAKKSRPCAKDTGAHAFITYWSWWHRKNSCC